MPSIRFKTKTEKAYFLFEQILLEPLFLWTFYKKVTKEKMEKFEGEDFHFSFARSDNFILLAFY